MRGSYLGLGLQHGVDGEPLIYANYISSLDGRIAVDDGSGEMAVPAAIANPRDWRLYQELAAQSSVMITSARYFRQLARGKAQALLPVDGDDLLAWRAAHGLSPQPDILILSRSLEIPPEALAPFAGRNITVLTGGQNDPQRRRRLLAAGVTLTAGTTVRQWMRDRHHASGYAIAGCGVLHTLLTTGSLDRLFLTSHHTLLGGGYMETLLRDPLPAPVRLQLRRLYLDQQEEQTFADYTLQPQANA